MSIIDEIEMICDWIAASKKHNDGDPLKSIEINADRFGYGEEKKNFYKKFVEFLK